MAMTLGKVSLDFRELVRDNLILKIDLKGVKSWRVRVLAGKQVLKLAAWVIGCGIRFDADVKEG